MPKRVLLPGVSSVGTPPVVVHDSARAIARARRNAALRDAGHVLLLLGVDYLFLHWPSTHVPFMDRADSMLVLAFLNAALGSHLWLTRVWPRWKANRISETWSANERTRFMRSQLR